MLLVPLNILLVLTLFAETFPLASRTTTVIGLTATEVSYPSSKSAFKFPTSTLELTTKGDKPDPVAMLENNLEAVTVLVAFKFTTLAVPLTYNKLPFHVKSASPSKLEPSLY